MKLILLSCLLGWSMYIYAPVHAAQRYTVPSLQAIAAEKASQFGMTDKKIQAGQLEVMEGNKKGAKKISSKLISIKREKLMEAKVHWLANHAQGLRGADGQYPLWLSLKYNRIMSLPNDPEAINQILEHRERGQMPTFALGGEKQDIENLFNRIQPQDINRISAINLDIYTRKGIQDLEKLNAQIMQGSDILSINPTYLDKLSCVESVFIRHPRNNPYNDNWDFLDLKLPDFIMHLPCLNELRSPSKIALSTESLIKLIEKLPDNALNISIGVKASGLKLINAILKKKKYRCSVVPVEGTDKIVDLESFTRLNDEFNKGQEPYGMSYIIEKYFGSLSLGRLPGLEVPLPPQVYGWTIKPLEGGTQRTILYTSANIGRPEEVLYNGKPLTKEEVEKKFGISSKVYRAEGEHQTEIRGSSFKNITVLYERVPNQPHRIIYQGPRLNEQQINERVAEINRREIGREAQLRGDEMNRLD